MARYVVPPKKMKREILLKCFKCGTLYCPDGQTLSLINGKSYEKCPVCGYEHNTDGQIIPLWKYNLIKYFRGMEEDKDDN